MKEIKFDAAKFKYADLSKCYWFRHENKIYFTDNINRPRYCVEKWWSFVLRKLNISGDVKFGKPNYFEPSGSEPIMALNKKKR